MPEYEDEYRRIVTGARNERMGAEGVPQDEIDRLKAEFGAVLASFQFFGSSEQQGAQVPPTILEQFRRAMVSWGQRLQGLAQGSVGRSIDIITGAHAQATEAAASIASVPNPGIQMEAGLSSTIRRQMLTRRGLGQLYNAESYSGALQTMTSRNLQNLGPAMDDFLQQVVRKGIDPAQATRQAAHIMANGDEQVLQAINQVSDRALHRGVWNEVGAAVEDLDVEAPRLRRLLSDSRRLVVTENNSAAFESQRLGSVQSNVVKIVEWVLSGRHYAGTWSPDVCTYYATTDIYGLGVGKHYPGTVSAQPHPHCGCYLRDVIASPSEWGDEVSPQPKREHLTGEDLREDMRQKLNEQADVIRTQNQFGGDDAPVRTVTDSYVTNQTKMAEQHLEDAWAAWQMN